ncbi:MAG: hypothetical protein ACR2QG_08825 [Gammaproteobacteria bacterium]
MGKRTEGKRSDRKSDNHRRMVLAQQAARLIAEHGIEDFRTAKHKAAENLGLSRHGALPNNVEIEQALAEHNRIFGGTRHVDLLADLRNTALQVMHELELFGPCLVGPVLSGNITEHSSINLHLFSDTSELIGMQLIEQGVRHNTILRKHKLRRDKVEEFPGFRFYSYDYEVEATVFPEKRKGHPPLSPVDGRPMKRAKLREVEALAFAS